MSTEILDLDEVTSSLGDKFITHNTALRQIEAKLIRVLSRTNGGPPGSIVNGDTYIVDVASGIWAAATVGDIAHAYGGAYYFYTPAAGWRVEVVDEGYVQKFDGTDWDDRMLHTKDDLSSDGTLTVVSGEIVVGPGGGGADPELDDNTARAYVIKEGTNDYLVMTTTDGVETITYGNPTTKPTHIFENGKMASGGEAAPDCGDGGLTLHHDSNSFVFTVKNPSVAHGCTSQQETDTYMSVSMKSGTAGGARLRGFSEIGNGLELEGFGTSPNTSDTAEGVIHFEGQKIVGTAAVNLTSSENLVSFGSGTAPNTVIKGNGRVVTKAGLEIAGDSFIELTAENGVFNCVGALTMNVDSDNNSAGGHFSWATDQNSFTGGTRWMLLVNDQFSVLHNTMLGSVSDLADEVLHVIDSSNPAIKIEQDGSATYGKIEADGTDMNIGTAGGAGAINFKVNDVTEVILSSTGQLSTGGETSPDVDPGGVCINHGANDGNALTFKNSDVAHGITTQAETDTYGEIFKSNASTGGLRINGMGEATTGVHLTSIATTTTTGDTSSGGILIDSAVKSGTTKGAFSATENILTLRNDNTVALNVKANGDLALQGGLRVSGGTDLLATYEEGTWTPELWDDTLATEGTPPTYTVQVGTYTRIGDLVHVQGRLSISSLGGLTSGQNLRLGGLPFTAENVANAYSTLAVGYARGMSITLGTSVSGFVVTNASHIEMELGDSTVGSRSMLVSEFSATGSMMFSAIYKA